MVFIFKRSGILVPVITFGSLLLLNWLADAIGGNDYYAAHVGPKIAAFALAAVAIIVAGKMDEQGGHFFFIPTAACGVIVLVLGIIFSITATGSYQPARQPKTAAAEPKRDWAPSTVAPAKVDRPPARLNYDPDAANEARIVTTPATATFLIDGPKFEQVYIDNRTKTYFPEKCPGRPQDALLIAKTAAKLQGYTLAAQCPPG